MWTEFGVVVDIAVFTGQWRQPCVLTMHPKARQALALFGFSCFSNFDCDSVWCSIYTLWQTTYEQYTVMANWVKKSVIDFYENVLGKEEGGQAYEEMKKSTLGPQKSFKCH